MHWEAGSRDQEGRKEKAKRRQISANRSFNKVRIRSIRRKGWVGGVREVEKEKAQKTPAKREGQEST